MPSTNRTNIVSCTQKCRLEACDVITSRSTFLTISVENYKPMSNSVESEIVKRATKKHIHLNSVLCSPSYIHPLDFPLLSTLIISVVLPFLVFSNFEFAPLFQKTNLLTGRHREILVSSDSLPPKENN